MEKTGRYRTINREKLQLETIERELRIPQSLRYYVYQGFQKLMDLRTSNKAFHPFGGQEILDIHPAVFSLVRISPDASDMVLCLQNVIDENIPLAIDLNMLAFNQGNFLLDLISQKRFDIGDDQLHLLLEPYQILWLVNLQD